MTSNPSDFDEKAKALAEKIRTLKGEENEDQTGGEHRGDSQALRLISDFSANTLVGCALGYGVDAWLETAPWALIVGLFLGVAAGTRRMLQQEK